MQTDKTEGHSVIEVTRGNLASSYREMLTGSVETVESWLISPSHDYYAAWTLGLEMTGNNKIIVSGFQPTVVGWIPVREHDSRSRLSYSNLSRV